MDRLAVVALGRRNAGKSLTWNDLFGRAVRTGDGIRPLELGREETVDVFVISGSPEERDMPVSRILGRDRPRIVLCSIQYADAGRDSIRFFSQNGYSFYVQWINPGYKDHGTSADHLGLIQLLLHEYSVVSIRNGRTRSWWRAREIRDFIRGWASSRRLLHRASL